MPAVLKKQAKIALVCWLITLALVVPRPVLGQNQGWCEGVAVVDWVSVPTEMEGSYLLNIVLLLENQGPTDVTDVEVLLELIGPQAEYPPVTLTAEAIPAGETAKVSTSLFVTLVPDRFSTVAITCRPDIEQLVALLHAAGPSQRQAAVQSFGTLTPADAPGLLEILQRRSASQEQEAEKELVEDLMLMGTLAHLRHAAAVPAFLDTLAFYRPPPYSAVYPRLLAREDVAPVPLLEEARRRDLDLEQVVRESLVTLGADAVPSLAGAEAERSPDQGGDVAAAALLDIIVADPQLLLGLEDDALRHSALEIVGRAQDPQMLDTLFQAALAHPGDQEQVVSLVAAWGPEAAGFAVAALESPDPAKRGMAYLILQAMDPETSMPALTPVAAAQGISPSEGMALTEFLSLLAAELEADRQARVEERMSTASAHLTAGDCQAAYEAMEEAREIDHDLSSHRPLVIEVYTCLGQMLSDGGDQSLAAEFLEEAVERGFDAAEVTDFLQAVYLAWADQASRAGDPALAAALLERAGGVTGREVIVTRLIERNLGLGRAALEADDWEKAQDYYVQAHELAPSEPAVRDAVLLAVAQRNMAYLILALVAGLLVALLFVIFQPSDPREHRR
jgi:tetratricopeptide (TPR) repeat protein